MRHTPHFLMTDPDEVRRLVRAHPWATIVSSTARGLIASHYPVILDEPASTGDDIVLLSHFGRPDDELHELGAHEILVIVQGPHDYVSPSWYGDGSVIPTWDHVTAHLYGTPEILSPEENFAALSLLTDHFEHGRPGGTSLADDEERSRRVAQGTVGLRVRVTRFEARAKLSQNKHPEVLERIIERYDASNPPLAEEIRRVTR